MKRRCDLNTGRGRVTEEVTLKSESLCVGIALFSDRLKDALAAIRPWHVLFACAILLTFVLALSAFIMAFNDGDQATTPPRTTTMVASEENANHASSPTPVAATTATTGTDRPATTTTIIGSSAGPSVPKCGMDWQRFQSQCYRVNHKLRQTACQHEVLIKMTSTSDFAGVEAECERNFKGSLVSVHDVKENAFITSKTFLA